MAAPERTPLSALGAFAIIWFSLLFGWEVIAPYFNGGVVVGDANTKAVLTNIVIAIVAYLFGRNEGSRQNEQVIAKLVDTNKKANDTLIDKVAPPADITIPPGESRTVTAEASDGTSPTA